MIAYIQGEVLFSDGTGLILLTNSGLGHEIQYAKVLPEGQKTNLYISHIIKEQSEDLFGFDSLREKKLFELLLSVNGVGPKSAFSLVSSLDFNQIVQAIMFDDKKTLTKSPGIGPKAASQIILDLSQKIKKMQMYSDTYSRVGRPSQTPREAQPQLNLEITSSSDNGFQAPHVGQEQRILIDTLLACKELGFKEEHVRPIADRIMMKNHEIRKPEQLIHLVLREI